MKIGYFSMNNDTGMGPAEVAVACEERGYDSFWVGEHSHIPVQRETPYPGGGDLPEEYWRMLDPFVALTAAAAATTKVRLCTGVCLVLEHDLIDLAKTLATLDLVSGGRLELGVGVGWNAEELANHRPDIPFRRRYSALREHCAALRTLWAEEQPSFEGEWVNFEPLWSYPKPAQTGGIPILNGSAGPLGVKETVAWCDGWAPIDAAVRPPGQKIPEFRAMLAEAGRDPATFPISLCAWGDPPEDRLRAYADAGVDRVVLGPSRAGMGDPDTVLPFLDRYAVLTAELA